MTVTVIVPGAVGRTTASARPWNVSWVGSPNDLLGARVGAAQSLEHAGSVDLDGDCSIFGVVESTDVVDERDLDVGEVGVVGADLGAVGADVECGEAACRSAAPCGRLSAPPR